MVKEFVASNDVRQITRLTAVLAEEFAVSHNNHSRKGGLIGLAATAIALGKVQMHHYVTNVQHTVDLKQKDRKVKYTKFV